ncbi:MAG: hypothetical protein COB07_01135 [Sulfurovum sp.]|nr:MAG: hypothetical protein COB07_01135 [Sulfurovum sp.]
MKQTLLFGFSSFVFVVLLTGCTGQMAAPGLSAADKEEACINVDRKLIKVDKFLTILERNSAFHIAEADLAMEAPGITESNNKTRMLKDGNKRRAELEAKRQKLGCEPL